MPLSYNNLIVILRRKNYLNLCLLFGVEFQEFYYLLSSSSGAFQDLWFAKDFRLKNKTMLLPKLKQRRFSLTKSLLVLTRKNDFSLIHRCHWNRISDGNNDKHWLHGRRRCGYWPGDMNTRTLTKIWILWPFLSQDSFSVIKLKSSAPSS